jgi:hypothetical protein
MVMSGVFLFAANPVQSYQNILLRTKMVMLLLACLNVGNVHSRVHRPVAMCNVTNVAPSSAGVAGAFPFVLWLCIVLAGRMIAYNRFQFDRQTQRPVLYFLISCVPTQSEQARWHSCVSLTMITGGLLFLSGATNCYWHEASSFKEASRFPTIVFTFTIRPKVILAGETRMWLVWSLIVPRVSIL